MPAPFQGAYKVSEELLVVLMSLATQGVYKVSEKRNLEFRNTFISSLKGKVAASFSEQTEGLRRFPLLTDTEPLKNLIDNLILHRITRNLP